MRFQSRTTFAAIEGELMAFLGGTDPEPPAVPQDETPEVHLLRRSAFVVVRHSHRA